MVIVTHGSLAEELLKTAAMIIGPLERAQAVSIDQGMSLDAARVALKAALVAVDQNAGGVIILTDLFGGTPTNISVDFLMAGQVEILTGVNLPMVLKCASSRKQLALEALAENLKEYSRTSIMRPAELVNAG
jgi:PTS system mannose-specific IIA component